MRLELTGRRIEITPALRRLAEKKLGKLDRLLNNALVSAQVVLDLQKYRHRVDVTLHARGEHFMHAVGDSDAWETSFSDAIEKIEQQAEKLKGKWKERKRRAAPAKAIAPGAPVILPGEEDEVPPRVMRASRYAVKPMTVEEAALAVNESREAFVVFRNANTDAINVLYRRKDGNLGLIEPEA